MVQLVLLLVQVLWFTKYKSDQIAWKFLVHQTQQIQQSQTLQLVLLIDSNYFIKYCTCCKTSTNNCNNSRKSTSLISNENINESYAVATGPIASAQATVTITILAVIATTPKAQAQTSATTTAQTITIATANKTNEKSGLVLCDINVCGNSNTAIIANENNNEFLPWCNSNTYNRYNWCSSFCT